ncbi:phosphate/phosphite/phosphonate ABC transporter substrate-binding protein [Ancylobacter sp. Lp-2]|uniref:phosphate/phosphite/phosphonate ABC transporter substrate-binding protein n=1 Tax=Ancylobacter sp. Lp-2 TaxID=2881339 RepID=UPI001E2BB44A|nr:PhnD/SsuA/transferrin family substrate-binding protein [Ancylobacter sp. Lp-2]MCB4767136.1 phosphate/phosphite/phosphonate ABC transporter substrate-binding protein [Ancylobacter sp. Lp-2]
MPDTTPPVACSRMYNLSPAIRAAWDELFAWLAGRSGVRLEVIAHAAPAPLSTLWSRPDMGAVFMCGYPFARLAPSRRPVPLAAPVSRAAWARGWPLYASHIVTRRDGPQSIAELATVRWGWTVRDSQSGYHAPRQFLLEHFGAAAVGISADGPFLNPSGVLAALDEGRIDAGPVDAYAWQLLELHEPALVRPFRIVATTASTPCPLLVAAVGQPAEAVAALRAALLGAHDDPAGRSILGALGLEAFAVPDIAAYATLPARADATDRELGATW